MLSELIKLRILEEEIHMDVDGDDDEVDGARYGEGISKRSSIRGMTT